MDYQIDTRLIVAVLALCFAVGFGAAVAQWVAGPAHQERCVRAGHSRPPAARQACMDSLKRGKEPPFDIPESGTVRP